MKTTISLLCVIFVMPFFTHAGKYEYPKLTTVMQQSDLVIVAKITNVDRKFNKDGSSLLRVERVLKGKADKTQLIVSWSDWYGSICPHFPETALKNGEAFLWYKDFRTKPEPTSPTYRCLRDEPIPPKKQTSYNNKRCIAAKPASTPLVEQARR
jgi:hypothetical protein